VLLCCNFSVVQVSSLEHQLEVQISELSAQALDLARMTAKMGEVEDEKRGWEVQVAAFQEELARCKREHQAKEVQASISGICMHYMLLDLLRCCSVLLQQLLRC
jgi:hypothetical protein